MFCYKLSSDKQINIMNSINYIKALPIVMTMSKFMADMEYITIEYPKIDIKFD
jgi:hypothetical protein